MKEEDNNIIVSVIMSIYNGARFLRDSIDSILNQTFSDFEFVIINDGSTDDTAKILEEIRDHRIVLLNQENCGLTKSLNRGARISKGVYIARQDADDISLPNRLELQVKFLNETPHIGFVGCSYLLVNENSSQLKIIETKNNPESLKATLLKRNIFAHGSCMFRKDLFIDIGGYREEFRYAQDRDLWLRMSERSLPGWMEHTPLYKQRIHVNSIGRKNNNLQKKFSETAVQAAILRIKGTSDNKLIADLKNCKVDSFKHFQFLSNETEKLLLEYRILLTNAKGHIIRNNLVQKKHSLGSAAGKGFLFFFFAIFLISYIPQSLRIKMSKIVANIFF